MRKKRKIITYVLSMALMLTSLPIQLFAQGTNDSPAPMAALVDTQTTTPGAIQINPGKYIGDGYEVEFKVTNQWTGAFNGEFVLTNTSDKPLENWTLKFNFEHEITNMWNAQIVTHEANSYIIKNMEYNQDIAPGSSVTVGFQANWTNKINIPQKYDLLISKQEVGNTGYTIDFKVTSNWGQAFNGEISITNNTEETIEDWSLEFDFDRNIEQFWAAEIVEHEGEHYIVKNVGYNANIAPGQMITLGFSGNPGNVDNTPKNYVLNQLGQTEKIDYTKDTDSDGLPDYFEKILGTDLNKIDTDEDGLPDGYEYFKLETNPALKDTDKNGIMDGNEDFDEDGLTNLDEYINKTNPYIEDTDEDRLTDGDEIHKYNTNPLKFDTDGDTLSDGDEIVVGLDPNNTHTFNEIHDSQYTTWQSVDEIYIDMVLPEEDPYTINISLLSSGNIKDNLVIEPSKNKNAIIENRAIIGTPINLEYNTGSIKEGEISFEIDPQYLQSNISMYPDLNLGLSRYCIFTYDEEMNLLYPIQTEYNDTTNAITAQISELGTYCVMDLEVWAYDLGITIPSEDNLFKIKSNESNKLFTNQTIDKTKVVEKEESISEEYTPITLDEIYKRIDELTYIEDNFDLLKAKTFELQTEINDSANKVNTPVDITFVIDTTGSMSSAINNVKVYIGTLITELYNAGITPNVAIVNYTDYIQYGDEGTYVMQKSDGTCWAHNKNEAINLISGVDIRYGAYETPIDGLEMSRQLSGRTGATKFNILITDEGYYTNNRYGVTDLEEMATLLSNSNMITSVVTSTDLKSTYDILSTTTGGEWFNIYSNFSPQLKEFILNNIKGGNRYPAILSSGLQTVVLDSALQKNSVTDTDRDGLTDSEEVNWDYITITSGIDGTSKIVLPTFKSLIESKTGYSTEGLEKIYLLKLILNIKVLPVNSNPTSEDSDRDYYIDKLDPNPLSVDPRVYTDQELDDTYCIDGEGYSSYGMQALSYVPEPFLYDDSELVYEDPLLSNKLAKIKTGTIKSTRYSDSHYDSYSITPTKNSDYKLTLSMGNNRDILQMKAEVYEQYWFNNRQVLVKPNAVKGGENKPQEYSYSLKKGMQYTIKVYCKNNTGGKYTLKLEQDNWVYAPSGGTWKYSGGGNGAILGDSYSHVNESIYISRNLLYLSACIEKGNYVKEESAIHAAMRELGYDEDDYVISIKDWTLTIVGFAGFAAFVFDMGKAGGFMVALKSTSDASRISFLIGSASTSSAVLGLFPVLDKTLQQMEHDRIYDILVNNDENIVCTHTIGSVDNIWDEWRYVGYINKYNQGYKGTVTVNIQPEDVIDFCKWDNPNPNN